MAIIRDIDGTSTYTAAEIGNKLVSYFTKYYPTYTTVVPDKPKLPGGTPIVLQNTTFIVEWDDVFNTWNELTNENGYALTTWDGIAEGDVYELEWLITKPATENPALNFSRRGTLDEYNSLTVILPYEGVYDVELKLYDLTNNVSNTIRKECINVELHQVEFAGYYTFREDIYSWNTKGTVTWTEYTSSWDLPILSNTELDDIDLTWYPDLDRVTILHQYLDDPNYLIQTHQPDGTIIHPGPYYWTNLDDGTWDESYHLWWDSTEISGDTPASFRINEIAPGADLYIDDGETIATHTFDTNILDLDDAASDLNDNTDSIISKYIYNPVKDIDGYTQYILAVGRYSIEASDFESVTGTTGYVLISHRRNSRTSNVNWENLHILKGGETLPKLVHIVFSYDKCKMVGKTNPKWTVTNTDTGVIEIYRHRYLSYMFKKRGRYNVSLEIEDTNGNKNTIDRNLLIIS